MMTLKQMVLVLLSERMARVTLEELYTELHRFGGVLGLALVQTLLELQEFGEVEFEEDGECIRLRGVGRCVLVRARN